MSDETTGEVKVLDHGYLRLVETWGRGDVAVEEAGIIEAARQSTQGSFRGWDRDERLLRFLFMNKPQHATPFEFCGAVVEVQAPILVFREWHRHRTQSYNEMSARYAPLPDINYMPTVERCLLVSQANKQAGAIDEAPPLTEEATTHWLSLLAACYNHCEGTYQRGLKLGLPKEVARACLPVGRYSRMRACANLRNWLAFLALRNDPGAQWEIRQYAQALEGLLVQVFPRTLSLFKERRDHERG